MTEQIHVPLSPKGLEVLKLEQTRSAFSSAVQGKFGCTIEFKNVAAASSFASGRAKITRQIKYSKQLPNGVNISVWKDDLTTHTVGAVVNAANEFLSHGAGLALALSKAGGPEINRTSKEIIKHHGKVPTGDAVLAPAGNLPCDMIIHAVGPMMSSSPSGMEIQKASDLLEKAIRRILEITDRSNLQSVAIPAISSGIYNFPLHLCAKIIVNTVKAYSYAKKSGHSGMDVRLVNNDDPSVCEMERACNAVFGPSDSPHMSGAVQRQRQESTQSVLSSLVLGNVTLVLKKGAIEDERTDVIVNTTGTDLDLSKGLVSVALLGKAGNSLQKEIKQFKSWHSNVPVGEVFETSGYALNCKTVFHTVCAPKDNTHANQILNNVVQKCLEKASAKMISSISFPAIGTGNLGLRRDEVAQIMIKAVTDFAPFCDWKLNVCFVIFPKDIETIRAFEKEMAFTQQRLDPGVLSHTNSKSQVSHSSVEEKRPCIMLFGNSTEALKEAKQWSLNILGISSHKVAISNNHVAHLDQDDHANLTKIQATFNVTIKELFKEGRCEIIINGEPVSVSQAAVEVEALLCKTQEQFAATEEREMNHWYNIPGFKAGSIERRPKDRSSQECTKIVDKLEKTGLYVEKVEEINNPCLTKIFELNKKRIGSEGKTLYQRVNAQFCNLICKVGFQREYAPPTEQKYGAGIYFTTDLSKAKYLWPDSEEVYVYIIVAQVLTGKSTSGSSGLILPPPIGNDPLHRHDSVNNIIKDIFVIFNGQLALPKFIITCKRSRSTGV
ncbi:protein mono-ADP-ribosyltransferase PARP9 [Trichomycterus rosablanca]|uniref:protein mono-ADP-ribosyltransferase PARP9 n=1 Tax=Trichomycterus rosablanca TaxID=2290929 RepID=UPI002F355C7C